MKLIFGANGQLGNDFKKLFDSIGEKYIATDKEDVDITNGDFLRAYVHTMNQNYGVDMIINCAAYNDVDRAEEEKELCYRLNTEAPANLAKISSEIGATFVTFSTDFVFNGRLEGYLYNENIGYSEEDEPHPLSTYSNSKYEGEILVNQVIEDPENTSKIYIIRTSGLFGKGNTNFIQKLIEWSKEKNMLRIVDDQVSSPTYTKDLVKYTWELLKKNAQSGLYHFTNDGTASKYDQAQYILDKISWQGELVRAKREDFHTMGTRPKFSKLNCKKIKETLGMPIPHWKNAVDRYFEELGN